MPKGIYKRTEEHKKNWFKNRHKPYKFWSGKKLPEKTKKKLSSSHKKNPTRYWLGKKFSIDYRKKLSEARKGRFGGDKHPNWKGGIDLENKRIRRSLEYQIWQSEVYKRDGWKCRLCGKHCQKKDIIAHHIKLFSDFPELRFSVENGITLCRKCHCKIHTKKI